VSLDDKRETDEHRDQQAPSAALDTGLFQRLSARINRNRVARRTVDLDSTQRWPDTVTIVERDEFGPLVIAISGATVFPDGSVTARGRWYVSARFGLLPHLSDATDIIHVDVPTAFVLSVHPTRLNIVTSIGPSLVTLGKSHPGIATMFPDLSEKPHHPITSLASTCGVTNGGFAITRGAARKVSSAVFARLPSAEISDNQVARFAETLRAANAPSSASIYLEQNNSDRSPSDPSMVDLRFYHESSGSRLVAVNLLSVEQIARAVSGASSVTVESTELLPFSEFASPTASVSIVDKTVHVGRATSRVTSTRSFDMDKALREGLPLPRGVEVISRPDYDIQETTVDAHRVFHRGSWGPQHANVLREHSLGPWLISVTNAIVSPNGSVLLDDGTLLAGLYFGAPRNQIPVDGWVTTELSGRAGLAITAMRGFGHGLLQVAPRVDAVNRFDGTMPILVSRGWWDDTTMLNVVGLDVGRTIRVAQEQMHHLVRVPELIVSTQLFPEVNTGRADPQWLTDFVNRLSPVQVRKPARRVYFARDDASGIRGGCANRYELDRVAAEFGYEAVIPESLSFPEQIRLATETVDMFGEQGSALTWSMFMPPESRLVSVQSKPDGHQNRLMTYHNPVLAARGSSFDLIGAVRAGKHLGFEVDPRALRRAMEQLP